MENKVDRVIAKRRIRQMRRSRARRSRSRSEWPVWSRYSKRDQQSQQRYLGISILVALILHILCFKLIPWPKFAELAPPRTLVQEFQVEVETSKEEEKEEPARFVETNPAANLDKPKETENYAASDQTAAQDTPVRENYSAAPLVEGEFEKSQKIVEGSPIVETQMPWEEGLPYEGSGSPEAVQTTAAAGLPGIEVAVLIPVAELETAPVVPVTSASQGEVPENIEEDGSLAGLLETGEGENDEMTHEVPEEALEQPAEEEKNPEEAEPAEAVAGIEVQFQEQTSAILVKPGERVPQPRPKINFNVPPGPLMKTYESTNRFGEVAIDANFQQFGAYQDRMLDAISAQWHLLLAETPLGSTDMGSRVSVRFVLDREGEIQTFEIRNSTSSEIATLIVQDAVLSRAPFGAWTEDMIRVLGDEQTITIAFYYR